MSRLPEFMQVVFWCLSGHSEGINIVAPDWKEEEFAEKAKRLMYVIHSLRSCRTDLDYNSVVPEIYAH